MILAERAVIIWDQAQQMEHFIREASIQTSSSDIGFLVPTPDTPELAEANSTVFDMAAFVGQPKRVPPTNYRSPWALVSPVVVSSFLHLDRLDLRTLLSGVSALNAPRKQPGVVAEHDVAGYHATTLAAEDEQLLSSWLKANHYLSTPELRTWLKPYVAAKWKINAFKLSKKDDDSVLTTRAIRLSFHTNRPFYPYSEPRNQQQASAANPLGRALRVAILSDRRMQGNLADQNLWPGKLEYAGTPQSISTADQPQRPQDWLGYAHLDATKQGVKVPSSLTTFIDESNPRPGTADLYFSAASDQSPFRGEAVDFSLPTQNRLVFRHSIGDVAALLLLVVLPAVPLYCGLKVLRLSPEEELNPRPKPRLMPKTSLPSIAPRKPWVLIVEILIGGTAMILGTYYGLQFVLLLLGQLISVLMGWSGGYWIWILFGLVLAVVPVIVMAWGVIFCGMNICRIGSGLPLWRTKLFHLDGGAWQGFMAACSFLAGSMALLAVMSIIASM